MFRTYVSIMLFIIAALLTALAIGLAQATTKLHAATDKVNNFSQKTDAINSTLRQIRDELKTGTSVPVSLPTSR